MLKNRSLMTSHGHITALRDVTMQINEHELVAIIGANGAGKSTLMGTLAGLFPHRKERIIWKGPPENC